MNDISIDKDDKIQVMILPSDTFFESQLKEFNLSASQKKLYLLVNDPFHYGKKQNDINNSGQQ